jgi:sarcosine oxidase delta subunit
MESNNSVWGSAREPEYSEDEGDPLDDYDFAPQSNRDRAKASGYRPAYEEPSRRPAAEREASFNALAWILEGATGFVEELRHNDLGLSQEFWVHAHAAQREGLLAARALLDQMLEATEAEQAKERESEQRRARRGGINVDF